MLTRLLKLFFFGFIVKPIVFIVLGLNIRGRERLPAQGPAILAPNHNSHLDTLVLMSLYPLRDIGRVRPVAAADYFLANRWLAWFSLNIIGIIPLQRKHIGDKKSLFTLCNQALDQGDILILFPEGSRGDSEDITELKKGIYHIANSLKNITIVPIILHGLGKVLPKGEALFVPFNCDVIIGENLNAKKSKNANEFLCKLKDVYNELLLSCLTRQSSADDSF